MIKKYWCIERTPPLPVVRFVVYVLTRADGDDEPEIEAMFTVDTLEEARAKVPAGRRLLIPLPPEDPPAAEIWT